MKALSIVLYGACLVTSLTLARAEDSKSTKEKKRPALTEEQKKARKDLLAKYDTNKDGKLDSEERKSISKEDRAKIKKAASEAGAHKAAKAEKAEKAEKKS